MFNPIILIPSRLQSTRLPRKSLAFIGKDPMIVHVWRQACQANIGPVTVACDSQEIAKPIKAVGGKAVVIDTVHATGSDCLQEALQIIDPLGAHDIIINLQGDLPMFPPSALAQLLQPFSLPEVDMVTFIQYVEDGGFSHAPVRVLTQPMGPWFRCLNFSRQILLTPYQHVGIYAFRRKALVQFAALSQTEREKEESLEQLRALENHFFISAVLLGKEEFLSVDTFEDLQYVRQRWAQQNRDVHYVAQQG